MSVFYCDFQDAIRHYWEILTAEELALFIGLFGSSEVPDIPHRTRRIAEARRLQLGMRERRIVRAKLAESMTAVA